MIADLCTNVSFRLYSLDFLDSHFMHFKLYPDNPCQIFEGLLLEVHVLPCPIGFDLSLTESRLFVLGNSKSLIYKTVT